jgi:hypothetical protein
MPSAYQLLKMPLNKTDGVNFYEAIKNTQCKELRPGINALGMPLA